MANLTPAVDDPILVPSSAPDAVRAARGRVIPGSLRVFLSSPLTAVGVVLFSIIVLAALCAPLLAPYAPLDMVGPLGAGPSRSHPFGTNDQGQDIFSQILYGARYSLAVGLGAGVAITVISTCIGMIAAYAGRWMDDLLSTIMNVFLVVPQLPLLLVIAAYVPFKGNDPTGAALTMIAVITITGWAWGARVMRAQTLTLRNRDFVQATVVASEYWWRIVFREIMPNMISLLANTLILSSMGAILTEAALDYLGIGSISQVTWGTMLNKAQANSALFSGEWWSFVFPGLAIALTAMSFILMNYGVDLVSNPQLRVVKERRRRRFTRSSLADAAPAMDAEVRA
jgi:ABC-type dipeptide/oligopeptide/nickel transport system permease subunit